MVVVCFSNDPSKIGFAQVAVANLGGIGLIYALPLTYQIAEANLIPTVYVNFDQGTKLNQYIYTAPWVPKHQTPIMLYSIIII